MARRRLTPEEEARLAEEAERLRDADAEWEYEAPRRISRGASPTAVLSARVPLIQLLSLRKIAAVRKVSLSDLLKEAIDAYVASSGPSVSASHRTKQLLLRVPARSPVESVQPGVRELDEANPDFVRPDTEKTIAS